MGRKPLGLTQVSGMLEYAIISGHDKSVSNVVTHRATREPYLVAQPKEVVAQDFI